MDEEAFKETYREVNGRPCAFAKAILTRCFGCARSRKVLLAEREAVACLSPGGEQRCREVLVLMREKALFALRLTQLEGPLPHGKEIKVQCGGLLGLRDAIKAQENDAEAVIHRALERYGSAQQLPFGELVRTITGYQPRKRR